MANYNFQFKCRMCGEIYTEKMTGNKNTAFNCVMCAVLEEPSGIVQAPHLLSMHCKSDHYGVADFIGCEIETD